MLAKNSEVITVKKLEQFRAREKPYDIRCSKNKGLIVRVQPTGTKTFYCEYARNKRYKIGSAAHLHLSQAQDRVRAIMIDYYSGVDPNAERRKLKEEATLRSLIDDYYEPWATSHLKSGKSLVKRLRVAFSSYLDYRISKLTIFVIERWRSERLIAGISPATANRDTGALRAVFSRAVEWGLIEANPLEKLKRLAVEDIPPPRYLEAEERERLYQALDAREERRREERDRYNMWLRERGKDTFPDLRNVAFTDHLKPMVLLSLHTGLRRGELFTLTWENVHIEHKTPFLTVRAAFAKSKKSRHVQLNDVAIQTLRGWGAMTNKHKNGLVFSSANGKELDNVSSSWKKLLIEADLHGFRWHDMRHDFASRLAMAGVNLNTIRELLGHSDYKMTLRYAHLSPNEGYAAVRLIT